MPRFAKAAREGAPGRFAALSQVARSAERWLLPAECLLCLEPMPAREPDALVCGLCRIRWRRIAYPLCSRCGQPESPDMPCRICLAWPEQLVRVRSAVWLDGGARDAVHRLKYDGWWRISEAMAEVMLGLEPLTGLISLIPIPLAAARLRHRGYNQAERLAVALARRLGTSSRPEWLQRTRDTATQTALTPEERQANVAGAFSARVSVRGTVVLVDDVFTTGATLTAAAAALAARGAERVEAVTFARATPPVADG